MRHAREKRPRQKLPDSGNNFIEFNELLSQTQSFP
jgi:hypothetical protein